MRETSPAGPTAAQQPRLLFGATSILLQLWFIALLILSVSSPVVPSQFCHFNRAAVSKARTKRRCKRC